MSGHRFDVFGRRMYVDRAEGGWRAFWLGNEGKRRPVEIAIPGTLDAAELRTFLADVFHECATERHPDVIAHD